MPVIQSTEHRPAAPPARRTSRSRPGRVRVLAYAAVAPIVGGYAAVASLIAVVVATASSTQLSVPAVLLAAIPGWLAAHHVPLGLGAHSLAVLPLLPTALLMLMVARAAGRGAARLHLHEPTQARLIVFPIAGAHAVVGMTIALVLGNSGPVTASPPAAFFGCGALSALAATVGVARRCCLLDAALSRVDAVVVRGLRAGVIGVAAMAAAGALVLALGLGLHWTTATAMFEQSGADPGSQFGMLLLTIGYLPNAIVAALAFAMGPGFTMGAFSIAPLHLTAAKVPAVPLFAALPTHQSRLLLGLMLAPLAVGVFLGWACRRIAPRPAARLRGVLVAAAVVGAVAFLLAALSGGRLGGAVYSPLTVPAGLVGAVALGWVLVPAGLVAWLAGPKPSPNRRPVPTAEPAPEPEPEPEVEAVVAAEPAAEEPESEPEEPEELDDEYVEEEDDELVEEESYEYDPGEYEDEDEYDEDDIVAELEAEADAELAAEDAEADGDEDHSPGEADDK
ncbi:DUF6350 family protein [Kutzneria buriramensis]|uniref:Uncharacterized protein n=1 Tax=Kutzneria buriramensis TaxID=1045776 RepID=A0A3E0IA76_9PSEU|nr:DUF6350 family protein [Kutzneria buriramensis]REH55622.1 hypothetical protein BCF44_101648 [Kutzneria buriramensis]